jgi:hypothetical protein
MHFQVKKHFEKKQKPYFQIGNKPNSTWPFLGQFFFLISSFNNGFLLIFFF